MRTEQCLEGNPDQSKANVFVSEVPKIDAPDNLFTSQHACGCGTFEKTDKHSGDKCNNLKMQEQIQYMHEQIEKLQDRNNRLEDRCLASQRMTEAYEKALCATIEAMSARNDVMRGQR